MANGTEPHNLTACTIPARLEASNLPRSCKVRAAALAPLKPSGETFGILTALLHQLTVAGVPDR